MCPLSASSRPKKTKDGEAAKHRFAIKDTWEDSDRTDLRTLELQPHPKLQHAVLEVLVIADQAKDSRTLELQAMTESIDIFWSESAGSEVARSLRQSNFDYCRLRKLSGYSNGIPSSSFSERMLSGPFVLQS